ncbi:MAG: LysR family transcriptional regulator [Cellvibrionaceae bacterium]
MNVEDLALFVRTSDTNSITASAEQLGLSPATASAALKRLEKQLGAPLFIRSTRQLRITAEGERFLIHCRQSLAALEEGKASLNTMANKVAGELRLSVSSDLGRNVVLPWLDDIMNDYPDLSLCLTVGDSLSDFYADKVDVALRYGSINDSSMVAFEIAEVDRVVCASPDYIKRCGEPAHPHDLKDHNCLLYWLGSRVFSQWDFSDKKGHYRVKVNGDRNSNDADIVRRWALAGHGIIFKSRVDMADDLAAGRVVELLVNYESPPLRAQLLCPSRKQVTPAVLILRELLRTKFATLTSMTKSLGKGV